MIPLKDDLPTHSFPIVTLCIIVLNVLAFFFQVSLGPGGNQLIYAFGATPIDLIHGMRTTVALPVVMTLFTSMFLHAGFLHLGGNMLYLWIFGNNIEDVMGRFRFILFYLICGVAAVYAHAFTDSHSTIPMVGASGAISGVLGAYLLLFPHARVLTLMPFGFFTQIVKVPAMVVLGFWFIGQFANGMFSGRGRGGVAWFAHVGGFLAGMALIHLFKKSGSLPYSYRS